MTRFGAKASWQPHGLKGIKNDALQHCMVQLHQCLEIGKLGCGKYSLIVVDVQRVEMYV